MTPKPFSVVTLAERWDCSESLIYKLVQQKKLRPFNIGTLIRIPVEEVERFEAAQAQTPDEGLAEQADAAEPRMPVVRRGRRRNLDGLTFDDTDAGS